MSTFPDPERSLGFLVHDISRLLRRDFNRRVQPLGLTQSQWQAIAHLSRQEGISQAALADIMEVQPISLARLIDRMEAAGWVERHPDPRDRRATRLFLSDKARPLLAEMKALGAGTREQAMDGLSRTEQDALIDTLARIKRNLTDADSHLKAGAPMARRKVADG